MNMHRFNDEQLCLVKDEFRSHLNYFGYSILPGKEDNCFGFYEFKDSSKSDIDQFNGFQTHNLKTKEWMKDNANHIKSLKLDIHKPGEGIPCKGLKLENMKKVAEL